MNKKTNKTDGFFRMSLTDKSFFINNLSMLLSSGLSITEALRLVYEQSKGRLKKISGEIYDLVSGGKKLADSMSYYPKSFPPIFLNIIRAGEDSGNLEKNLSRLGAQIEEEKDIKEKLKNALIYPLVVLVLGFAIALIVSLVVLPKITPIFVGMNIELPLSTRLLIGFSSFIQSNPLLFLFGNIFGLAFLIWFFRRRMLRPLIHFLILHTPLFREASRSFNLAIFSSTLSSLLKSGIAVEKGLSISSEVVSNFYFQKSLARISEKVASGQSISASMQGEEDLFTGTGVSIIKVAEKSGRLEESLDKLAEINEKKLNSHIKRLSALIEPLLLLLVGLVVGWLAIAIITPIYEISSSVYK